MHVYFVRHGETILNRRHVHQSPNTPLSERGRGQAAATGEALRSVNPDMLISSEYTRALETARVIGLYTGLTPVVPGLFYEIVRPSNLFERFHFMPKTLWYVAMSVLMRNDPEWRYKDAENFTDVYARGKKALKYLESLERKHGSVVVVSHTVFINLLISHMCETRLLTLWDLAKALIRIERMKNCGILHLEYVSKPKNVCGWRIVRDSVK